MIPLLVAATLILAGCIQSLPAPDDASEAVAESMNPPPPPLEDWVLHWHGHMEEQMCIEAQTTDTCEGVPTNARRTSMNPGSGHTRWHRVPVETTPVAVDVRAAWHDEGEGSVPGRDVVAEPRHAIEIWCWNTEGGPCSPAGHRIAETSGTGSPLALDRVGLEWFDESTHVLWLSFRVLPETTGGLTVYPDVQTSFWIDATFEVGHE